MRNQLTICNDALDELPSGNIQSIEDPDDVGARACKRHYQTTLEDLLAEWDYDAAIRRAILAETTNDRPGEWVYCYTEPSEARGVLRVLPNYTANYYGAAYTQLEGQSVWTGIGYFPRDAGTPYIRANGKIYSNTPQAVCEYITADVNLGLFSSLFGRAFALELASRIVVPVLKDYARQKTLIGAAEVARQRAIADDQNNSPRRYDIWPSEDAIVRAGGSPPGGWYGGGS